MKIIESRVRQISAHPPGRPAAATRTGALRMRIPGMSHDGQGGFTLAPQLSRPSSPFVAAAAGGDADTLEGGKGDDHLYGGTGGDTYHFNPGDGEDHVYDRLADGDNLLSFGAGIGRGFAAR